MKASHENWPPFEEEYQEAVNPGGNGPDLVASADIDPELLATLSEPSQQRNDWGFLPN